jgi:hypothetical protein
MSISHTSQAASTPAKTPTTLNLAHEPGFWIAVLSGSLVILVCLLLWLATYDLYLLIWPGAKVTTKTRTHNWNSTIQHTGRLVLVLPGVAWVWHGRAIGVKTHFLHRTTITLHHPDPRALLILRPINTQHNRYSQPALPISLPTPPHQAHITSSWGYNQGITPPGLEFSFPSHPFGPESSQIRDPQHSSPSASLQIPTTSNLFLIYGASRTSISA